jgi:hypothetical protein
VIRAASIIVVGTIAGLAIASAVATTANADTVTGQGTVTGNRYRVGVPAYGGVNFAAGVQVSHDPSGEIVHVRAAARITKLSHAARVQVDRVALGTSTRAVSARNTPANSGIGSAVTSYTAWRNVTPQTCTAYRVRANYSIRWNDGAVSKFSVLSALTTVCGPTGAPVYANCAAMHRVFPHGVGRTGAHDHTSGTPVTNFYVSNWIYNANPNRDADHDGIGCEQR